MNVGSLVPTPRTRAVAQMLLRDATKASAVDAVLNHLDRIEDDQVHALIGVLLTAAKQHRRIGRPRLALKLTEAKRREMHTRYRRGEREPEVVEGEREYQRVNQQARRARAPRMKGVPA